MIVRAAIAFALICAVAHADEIVMKAVDTIAADASVGIELRTYSADGKEVTPDMLPLLHGPSPLSIEMVGMPEDKVPRHALIEIDGEKHCLLAYNDTCVIMGNKLTVE